MAQYHEIAFQLVLNRFQNFSNDKQEKVELPCFDSVWIPYIKAY